MTLRLAAAEDRENHQHVSVGKVTPQTVTNSTSLLTMLSHKKTQEIEDRKKRIMACNREQLQKHAELLSRAKHNIGR